MTRTPSPAPQFQESLPRVERLLRREIAIFIALCCLLASFVAYGAAQTLDPAISAKAPTTIARR